MSDPILVGKLVADRYRVVRRLGAGGMGTVYVAVQEPLGREVALKVVRRDLSGDERTVERFRREAVTLSQAHHPHIVTLHDFGELEGGALYFAMELVRGENLRQRLQRGGPLPVKKTLGIVRDVASALAAAHQLGIIHRDLKPENILLMEAAGSPDFVKIVDFGVAKLVRDDDKELADQEALTQRGSVVGTPGYIAPEVALRGVTTDARSDLYALGVVWFECLAGHAPFRARTATALLMAHALDPVPSLPDEIPLPVAGLVQRLLAKNPDDRPDSAEELSALIDALPIVDSAAAVPRPNTAAMLVEASAATVEEMPRVSPARPAAVPDTAQPPTPTMQAAASLPTEAASSPFPAAPGPDRRSLVVAASLIAAAIVVAAVAMGLLLRPDAPAAVDAGAALVPAVPQGDAGPAPLDAGSAPARDAGVAAPIHVDAGRPTRPHPRPLKHPRKPVDDGPHVPDIYSP